jgi:3'(2'), 5'-bisphosphate nucleotidase
MLSKIISIAKESGNILMEHYSQGVEVQTKTDAFDFLTVADLKSDEFIRGRLAEEFPDDKILSEENKDVPLDYSGRVWMVDPLDGTKDFVNRGTGFSVMIGLCENGVPVLGVVYAPAKEMLLYAEKGKGAYYEKRGRKKRLQVSDTPTLEESGMVTRIAYGEPRPLDEMLAKLNVACEIPEVSVGLKLGLIAQGTAEFNINTNFRAGKWDTCAPQIILEEAGGKITDFDGKPLDYKKSSPKWERSYVASNSRLHEKIIDFIKEHT